MEEAVMKTKDETLIERWRKLQTSDHFYYMCTKWSNDGDVHAYFSPYQSPYDAYIAFMNALSDLQLRVSKVVAKQEVAAAAAEEKLNQTRVGGIEILPENESILSRLKRWWQLGTLRFRSLFVLK
jgi:alpha-amylase